VYGHGGEKKRGGRTTIGMEQREGGDGAAPYGQGRGGGRLYSLLAFWKRGNGRPSAVWEKGGRALGNSLSLSLSGRGSGCIWIGSEEAQGQKRGESKTAARGKGGSATKKEVKGLNLFSSSSPNGEKKKDIDRRMHAGRKKGSGTAIFQEEGTDDLDKKRKDNISS